MSATFALPVWRPEWHHFLLACCRLPQVPPVFCAWLRSSHTLQRFSHRLVCIPRPFALSLLSPSSSVHHPKLAISHRTYPRRPNFHPPGKRIPPTLLLKLSSPPRQLIRLVSPVFRPVLTVVLTATTTTSSPRPSQDGLLMDYSFSLLSPVHFRTFDWILLLH
ncbi:hypothetical protein CC79DRAFT_1326922 [Sarocladium strictum]